MKFCKDSVFLYLVTDRTWLNGRTLVSCVEDAIISGVTMVQLREKDISKTEFLKLAYEIKNICKFYKVPFIVNDNLDIAKEVDADGIHIGQDDITIDEIRGNWSRDKIVGISVSNLKEAYEAQMSGASYIGIGAIFKTKTKNDAKYVSLELLKEIASKVKIPTCAIGGIDKNSVLQLKDIRIDGIALVSAVLNQNNIKESTKELKELFRQIKG